MVGAPNPETAVCQRSGKPCPYGELALKALGVEQTEIITKLSESCVDFVRTVEQSQGIYADCAIATATILWASREHADA